MNRGNVLVIGNSGVGKSTLINAILGEEVAETGWGSNGTTKELAIFESDNVPFRIIDTIGFEPTYFKEMKAIDAVKKWSKQSAKQGKEDNQINLIWICIEGTSSKLFPKVIKDISKATSLYKTVPIIVVITKSYSEPDRINNVDMVNNVFAKQKRYAKNLCKVIPVVASSYVLNENAFAPPCGLIELIDTTNNLLPDGIKASKEDIAKFKLARKRVLAQGVTGVSTSGAVVIGAVPIPLPDAALLAPLEIAMINAIAQIYDVKKKEGFQQLLNAIVEIGTVSLAAKGAINLLKAVPGVNIGATVLNAIVAGGFVAVIGESAVYIFEQIYLGKKSINDLEWAKQFLESKLAMDMVDKIKKILDNINPNADKAAISLQIFDTFKNLNSKEENQMV